MDNHGKEQAAAQLNSIRAMVAALNVDYDRIAELRDERDASTEEGLTVNGCESREDAEQRIQEAPASVEVRSGWYAPGCVDEKPVEFQLLWGSAPTVRLRGVLDESGRPSIAWLEYQNTGEPWASYLAQGVNDVLVEYASQFYFGE